jgi:hypothetical protein
VTKSSNHTLILHRLTSASSSITNFPWLSPTDNWPNSHSRTLLYSLYSSVLLQLQVSEFDSLIFPRHGPHSTENTARYCYKGVLPRSCLANNLGEDHIENSFHSFGVLLEPRTYWFVTQQQMSSFWERNFGDVFTEPLPRNGNMRHNILRCHHCENLRSNT